MRMVLAFERARAMRHTCENMSVWIRVLIFVKLRVEDGDNFIEKTCRGWRVLG